MPRVRKLNRGGRPTPWGSAKLRNRAASKNFGERRSRRGWRGRTKGTPRKWRGAIAAGYTAPTQALGNTLVGRCAASYARVLIDPFSAAPSCLPYQVFPIPTWPVKSTIRGTMYAGTTGNGMIYITGDVQNTGAGVSYSTTTSVFTPATAITACTNTNTSAFSSLPYNTLSAGSQMARLVGMGIKIVYVGAESTRAGVVYALETQGQNITAFTPNAMGVAQESIVKPVEGNGTWVGVSYTGPNTSSDLEFSTAITALFTPSIAMVVVGAAASAPFQWEATLFLEYSGTAIASAVDHPVRPGDLGAGQTAATTVSPHGSNDPTSPPAQAASHHISGTGPPGAAAAQQVTPTTASAPARTGGIVPFSPDLDTRGYPQHNGRLARPGATPYMPPADPAPIDPGPIPPAGDTYYGTYGTEPSSSTYGRNRNYRSYYR